MNRLPVPALSAQRGAATLLMALILMMALTIVTLSTAKTRINEEQANVNQQWQTRLFAAAESALEQTLADLATLTDWVPDAASGGESYDEPISRRDAGIETVLTLWRSPKPHPYVDIDATARRRDGSALTTRIHQRVRQLSILTPLAETAPPLLLAGCPLSFSVSAQIYPEQADTDAAGNGVWLADSISCPGLAITDLHGGDISSRKFSATLHDTLFTLDRAAYRALAEAERDLPAGSRRYWLVQASDLDGGRWSRSIGTPERHVILYFPEEAGCPSFADGVQITGFVFIESPCDSPLASRRLDINGTLAINGSAQLADSDIRLTSLQTLDPARPWFNFPVLHNIRVPGSWKDF